MKSRFQYEIWCLLKKNISKGQLAGYAIANVIGLTVVLIGIMFFSDARSSGAQADSYFSDDYVVLSKKVEGIGFDPVCFSEEDIDKLGRQDWVVKIGRFTSSRFAVYGDVSAGGRGIGSYLFCESVPNDFFDIAPKDWYFDPKERFVPIIISKDYLSLYNFGFAIPQGLPLVSEKIVGAIPIRLRITGEDNVAENFEAAIVGFSSRLNTIAVPQDFMDWANERYSSGKAPDPSRLIVKIDRLAAADMRKYLQEEDIEIAGDMEGMNNISAFVGIVSSVVSANGAAICALALFILILSIYLLLQKSRQTLRNLMLQGFSPDEISRYYIALVVSINACITMAAALATFACRMLWIGPLREIGLGGASVLPVLLAAFVYLVFVTLINIRVIRRKLLGMWRG